MKRDSSRPGWFGRFRRFAFNQMASPLVEEKDGLRYWRVRILFAILFTGVLLGLAVFVPVSVMVVRDRLWALGAVDAAAWLISACLLFSRRLSYETRATLTLLMPYAIGLAVILSKGPLSGGPAWLFAFAVLVGVLLGSRAAMGAVALNALTLGVIGWMINTDRFGQGFPFFESTRAMVVTWVNFVFLNAVTSISVTVLVKGLVAAHKKEKDLSSYLERERTRLMEAKGELELEARERKRAQEAREEQEKRYGDLIDSITDFIYSHDLEGRFISLNRAALDALGYAPEEIIGRPITDFVAPSFKKALREEYLPRVRAQKRYDGVAVYVSRDGKKQYIEFRSVLVRQEGREPLVTGSGRNITERIMAQRKVERLREELQRSQKMEALGLMAGGVAHDLNNILSGIVSYPELLLMELPEDSPLRKPIKTIQESGIRAAEVVEDLLTVARGVATTKETSNLNTLIEEYLDSAEYRNLAQRYPSVVFRTEVDPGLLNIRCSPIHIRKSLMNLVTNASEAIKRTGTVTIAARNRYLDEPLKGYEEVHAGEYVVLSVSDDGSGISPPDLKRIFEPFYTKKVMGRSGTGLGLAVVWNTVQDHQGYIDVKSSRQGTVFDLYFPATREKIAPEDVLPDFEEYQGNGETILVVDDQHTQREIACGMLRKLGYRARAVAGGREAVEYVKHHPVDLIVLDMVMPNGMNGRQTYREIIRVCPGKKAIIASGFSKTREVELTQRLGAGRYIRKPYLMKELGQAVREELEK